MNKPNFWLALLCVAISGTAARADLIFSDGGSHVVDSTINDVIGVFDGPGPTTVTFRGAANITGTDVFDDTVYVEDTSTVIIEQGMFRNDVSAYNASKLIISGGQFNDDIYVQGDSRAEISGGNVVDDVEVDGGTVVITGGTFGEDLEVIGGHVTVFGGNFVANGVAFADTGFGVADGGTLVLNGFGFSIDGNPVDFGEVGAINGLLSGQLHDGTALEGIPFTTDMFGDGSLGRLVLATPEPSSACLLALLVPALLPRRSRPVLVSR